MPILQRLQSWAHRLKREALTLWFVCRHPGTPRLARAVAVFVVAYALSPIDLIPDFVPLLGYLDDLMLLPLLVLLVIRLTPAAVLDDCHRQAEDWVVRDEKKPRSLLGAAIIVATWLLSSWALWHWCLQPWLAAR
ncbi:MAG: DUF1232 domain-containing protein [Hylemonella sp.]|nr:DUF1232 domain-containing protein [Hylemonella sp.]